MVCQLLYLRLRGSFSHIGLNTSGSFKRDPCDRLSMQRLEVGQIQLRYEMAAEEMLGAVGLSRVQEYKPSLLQWDGKSSHQGETIGSLTSSGLQMKMVG